MEMIRVRNVIPAICLFNQHQQQLQGFPLLPMIKWMLINHHHHHRPSVSQQCRPSESCENNQVAVCLFNQHQQQLQGFPLLPMIKWMLINHHHHHRPSVSQQCRPSESCENNQVAVCLFNQRQQQLHGFPLFLRFKNNVSAVYRLYNFYAICFDYVRTQLVVTELLLIVTINLK